MLLHPLYNQSLIIFNMDTFVFILWCWFITPFCIFVPFLTNTSYLVFILVHLFHFPSSSLCLPIYFDSFLLILFYLCYQFYVEIDGALTDKPLRVKIECIFFLNTFTTNNNNIHFFLHPCSSLSTLLSIPSHPHTPLLHIP